MWPLFSHLEGLIKRRDALCGNIISIIFLSMVSIFALRQEHLVTHPSRHPALPERHTIPHIPAIWADHGVSEPLNGLATDVVGLGPDGGLWGGGLLRLAGVKCDRLAHLRPLRLPLGDGTGGTGCRARPHSARKRRSRPWRRAVPRDGCLRPRRIGVCCILGALSTGRGRPGKRAKNRRRR